MPKAQTKATDKWQKKVGIISPMNKAERISLYTSPELLPMDLRLWKRDSKSPLTLLKDQEENRQLM